MARQLLDTEIEMILAQIDSLRDRALVIVARRCGYRISELLSLKISSVVQYGTVSDTVTVNRRNMKGKVSSRTIVLHPEAKEAIHIYLTQLGVLNRSRFDPNEGLFGITRQHADRILKQAATLARIKGRVSFHSLRKAFCMSVYSNSGKDIAVTQKAMGHVSLSSTSHYVSASQEAIDRAILGQ